ncbi:MAG: hypothetical protein Q9192_005853 [Flavoplaca navasiana]
MLYVHAIRSPSRPRTSLLATHDTSPRSPDATHLNLMLLSGGAQQTIVDGNEDDDEGKVYQPRPTPSQGGDGYQQPTPSENGSSGNQQPTQTLGGDYEQPTTTYGGGYGTPVETPYQAYGQEDDDDDN